MQHLPLSGARVVVTRAAAQASTLTDALLVRGAEVVEFPTLLIVEPADGGAALRRAIDSAGSDDWFVVTSSNGAARLAEAGRDRSGSAWPRLAAIGPGTAAELARLGLSAELVAERFVAEGLLEVFPPPPDDGGRVVIAQAAGARAVLADGLRDAGWAVEVVEAYRTERPSVDQDRRAAAATADVVTFTSASTVRAWTDMMGGVVPPVVACIGPITAAAARDAGISVDVVADPHTIEGLVDAVVERVAGTVA